VAIIRAQVVGKDAYYVWVGNIDMPMDYKSFMEALGRLLSSGLVDEIFIKVKKQDVYDLEILLTLRGE